MRNFQVFLLKQLTFYWAFLQIVGNVDNVSELNISPRTPNKTALDKDDDVDAWIVRLSTWVNDSTIYHWDDKVYPK